MKGGGLPKKIFGPFGAHFGLKIRGGRAPPLDQPLRPEWVLSQESESAEELHEKVIPELKVLRGRIQEVVQSDKRVGLP